MMKFLRLAIILALSFEASDLISQNVVISEVYGGGGNSGAIYKNDFIELYNPTPFAIDLTGWSVQYISATGTGTWQKTPLSGFIAPRSYYLIQQANGSAGTTNLPTPDATGTIGMATAAGKVALVSNNIALTGVSPSPNIVDLVGFGGTANFYEGSGPASAPSNTTSIERKANASSTSSSMKPGGADEFSGNGYDSNNNNADFATRSPEPQNSLTAPEPDVIPPSFSASYPQSSNITSDSFDLDVNLSEAGKVYFVVLASGATAPSALQVKGGKDSQGNLVTNKGSIMVSAIGTDFSTTVSGLSSGTNYDVYVAAEDLVFNLQANVTLLSITTNVAPSIAPSIPSYTFVGFTEKSKQSASASYTITALNLIADVTVSVAGDFLISSDNNVFTTSVNIVAADFGTPQTIYLKFNPSGNIGNRTGTITHSSTGASDKTISLSAVSIDPLNQNFNDPLFLSNSGWTQHSLTGSQVWASTNFGHTCLTGCNNATVDKAAQMNGYSGSAKNNEDWLISPPLDLTTFTNYPALSFSSISAFAGDALQLKYSTDYSGAGDPAAATWISINGKFPPSNSSVWTTSSNIILPKSMLYVAFVYTSNTTSASRWTLDDWKVEDVSAYVDVPAISYSFGEIVEGNSSPSQSFTISAKGYGDITVTVPTSFEVSLDNTSFSSNLFVTQAEASAGKTIFVRFNPPIKQLQWTGSINFGGTGLNISYGTLTGSSYPKSETFNVATYNLEFFGTDVKDANNFEFGPTDDALQVANVTTVLKSIGADIFAVEEISDDNAFNQLVSNLPGFNKVVADRWSYSWQPPDPNYPPQKTGFIYNSSRVQFVSSRVMFAEMYDSIIAGTKTLPSYPTGTSSSFWSSGRLPFMATFDVELNGVKRRIRIIDIHAKSASDQESYNRRQYDSKLLHDSLNAYYPHDNIILLGDFNDKVYGSITTGASSSYKIFVDDAEHFKAITYDLNVSGASTFPSSNSLIDNIIISDELVNAFVTNSVVIEDPRSYISSYSSTTSDHLPVWSRFLLSSKADQMLTFNPFPPKTFGDPKFALSVTASSGLDVSYASSDPSIVSISGNIATILKAGTVTITAGQSGDEDFNAFSIDQSLIINKAEQTISFDELPAKVFGDDSFVLDASSSSNMPVIFSSSDPLIASVEGNIVSIVKAGLVTITASQAGDSNYNAAEDVEQQLTIDKANQKITFGPISAKTLGESPFTVSATSSAGLEVGFSSSSDKVTIDGAQVKLVNSGRTFVSANQTGNENYYPAAVVQQSFCINPIRPIVTIDNSNPNAVVLASSSSTGNQWYFNGAEIENANMSMVTASKPGSYKVQAHADDCFSEFSKDADVVITGIEEQASEISIYPNPAEDYLNIKGISNKSTVFVFDFTGKSFSVATEEYNDGCRAPMEGFAPGIYVVKIIEGSVTRSFKFIKK